MRANPLVCVEVDEIRTQFEWASVVASGRYEELPDVPEWQFERSVAHAHLQTWAMWWEPASVAVGPPMQAESRSPVFYRISIESMTGRHAVSEEAREDDQGRTPGTHREHSLLARMFAAFRQ
jgi:nitroimidazol reductase NimA-like FMN-containing flavoprotein (pyridoxamine 5'-phosphate oxidase superfamily)